MIYIIYLLIALFVGLMLGLSSLAFFHWPISNSIVFGLLITVIVMLCNISAEWSNKRG